MTCALPEQLEDARMLAVRPDTLLVHDKVEKIANFLRWHQHATETLVDLDDAKEGTSTAAGRREPTSECVQQTLTVKPDPDEAAEKLNRYDVDRVGVDLEELRQIMTDGEQCINALEPDSNASGALEQVDRHPFLSRLRATLDGAEDLAMRVRALLRDSMTSVSSRPVVTSACVSMPVAPAPVDQNGGAATPKMAPKTFVKREFIFSGPGRLGMAMTMPTPFNYDGRIYRTQVKQVSEDSQAEQLGITVGMWIHSINNNIVCEQQSEAVMQELKRATHPLILTFLVGQASQLAPHPTNLKPISLSAFIKQLETLMTKIISTRVAAEAFEEAQMTLDVARWYKRAALATENRLLVQVLDTLVNQADKIQIFDNNWAEAAGMCIGRQCLTLTPIDESATVKRNSNTFKCQKSHCQHLHLFHTTSSVLSVQTGNSIVIRSDTVPFVIDCINSTFCKQTGRKKVSRRLRWGALDVWRGTLLHKPSPQLCRIMTPIQIFTMLA